MAVRRLLLAALLFAALPAFAMNSWLVSGPPTILSVTVTSGYFSGSPTSGTLISPIVVATTGSFTGTLTLGGADAAKFAISGSNLNTAATLTPGIDYALTITPTQAGYVNSGKPTPIHVYGGLQYYMSVSGDDANSGTSTGSPWRTTAHNVHCADTINAAAGSYPPQSLGFNTWGVSTCPNNDNVAWVKCSGTLGTCLVNGDYLNKGAVTIDQSYWGVQGFQATDPSNPYGGCFAIQPRFNTITVHHIAFANNVANTCPLAGVDGSGFGGSIGPSSYDYWVWAGNLVWNGAASSAFCGSAFSAAGPAQADNAPGSHALMVQNIGVGTTAGQNCVNGGVSGGETDGQGLILDRFDILGYKAIVTIENNLFVGNGGIGIHQFINGAGGSPVNVYVRNNTLYGNQQDPGECAYTTGELSLDNAGTATATDNIFAPTIAGKCAFPGVFAQTTAGIYPASLLDRNWLWNYVDSTNNIAISWETGYACLTGPRIPSPGTGNTTRQICPNNIVADPLFTGPTATPGQWFCSGFSDTMACAATTIARFTPTAPGSANFGFTHTTPVDQFNSTPFFRNVLHALPAALNPHGF